IFQVFMLIFILMVHACSIDGYPDGNYIIFGHSYGECLGTDCVKVFKLSETGLYFDTRAIERQPDNRKFKQLPESEFIKAKDLWELFPSQLLSMPDTTFGCPDCRDQGAIILEFSVSNTSLRFSIDQDKNEIPKFLHGYVNKINEIIMLIEVK
ncbi:MAG: hypothetical protein RIR48_1912, partial [Bacteroidota bacterium]